MVKASFFYYNQIELFPQTACLTELIPNPD